MDELAFLGALIAMALVVLFLVRAVSKRQTGRQRNHPVYHESASKRHNHLPASHKLVHNHSTERIHAADDVWRRARLKSNEVRWENGVIVANKILTDSELALEERDPEQEHGMPSIHYKPVSTSRGAEKKSAGKGSGRR